MGTFDVAPLKQYIGEGNIYIDVKVPAASASLATSIPQEFLAPTTPGDPETGIPLDKGGTLGATCVGLTNGPATLEYKPEFSGVEVEQTTGEVAPRMKKEAVTLKFKCAAATWQNIQMAVQTGTKVTTNGTGGAPNKQTIHVGGLTFFEPMGVCLVSPIGEYMDTESTPKLHRMFEWVTLYQRMSVSGVKLDYKRNETRMFDVEFTGYADPNRPAGDQFFQLGQDTDPTL